MNKAISIALVALGIVAGAYIGVWWAFIGGIVDLVHAVRATELDSMRLAIGIAKIFFAGLLGWMAFLPFGLAASTLTQRR